MKCKANHRVESILLIGRTSIFLPGKTSSFLESLMTLLALNVDKFPELPISCRAITRSRAKLVRVMLRSRKANMTSGRRKKAEQTMSAQHKTCIKFIVHVVINIRRICDDVLSVRHQKTVQLPLHLIPFIGKSFHTM